jgi:hypothetical protein
MAVSFVLFGKLRSADGCPEHKWVRHFSAINGKGNCQSYINIVVYFRGVEPESIAQFPTNLADGVAISMDSFFAHDLPTSRMEFLQDHFRSLSN